MPRYSKHLLPLMLACGLGAATPSLADDTGDTATPIDLMSFAHGALPVSLGDTSDALRIGIDHAVAVIDGNPRGFVAMLKPVEGSEVVSLTYALPALTRFDYFGIPNVLETPSPSQTFFKNITVLGSDTSADGPFVPLAQANLATHDAKGQTTALNMVPNPPEVQWIRLRMQDGIDVQRDKTFMEFSELIGRGTQRSTALFEGFNGVWRGRGVKLELAQQGTSVIGCYDGTSRLTGTVQGNILRALGADPAGVASHFILIAAEDGAVRGLRSSNGAPFKPYDGEASSDPLSCLAPEPPQIGCGSIVHGIGFDFDSDVLQPASFGIIQDIFAGLTQTGARGIRIIGHSSSEGADAYNLDLSQRRAQSVVAALVGLGVDAGEISATGRGEAEPIASNADEAGRSMNRRVEVQCAG